MVKLDQLAYSDHVSMELDEQASWDNYPYQKENCCTHAIVVMPHHTKVFAWVVRFHFYRDVDTEKASIEKDHREQEMSLNCFLDPNFELLLALKVDASIQVFIWCFVHLTIQVPFHSDQVTLRALQLIDIWWGKRVLVFPRRAACERLLVRRNTCSQASNTSNDELKVILVNISHQVSNFSLVWEHVIFVFLEVIEKHCPLCNEKASKHKLQNCVDIDCEEIFDIPSPSSKNLIQAYSTSQNQHPNTVAQG